MADHLFKRIYPITNVEYIVRDESVWPGGVTGRPTTHIVSSMNMHPTKWSFHSTTNDNVRCQFGVFVLAGALVADHRARSFCFTAVAGNHTAQLLVTLPLLCFLSTNRHGNKDAACLDLLMHRDFQLADIIWTLSFGNDVIGSQITECNKYNYNVFPSYV